MAKAGREEGDGSSNLWEHRLTGQRVFIHTLAKDFRTKEQLVVYVDAKTGEVETRPLTGWMASFLTMFEELIQTPAKYDIENFDCT